MCHLKLSENDWSGTCKRKGSRSRDWSSRSGETTPSLTVPPLLKRYFYQKNVQMCRYLRIIYTGSGWFEMYFQLLLQWSDLNYTWAAVTLGVIYSTLQCLFGHKKKFEISFCCDVSVFSHSLFNFSKYNRIHRFFIGWLVKWTVKIIYIHFVINVSSILLYSFW